MALKSKKLGDWGERLAEREYLRRGYVLVARNFHNNRGKLLGEIDLLFRTHKELIFVEVKTRRSNRFGPAVAAVPKQKQMKIIKTIHWFLRRFPQYANLQPRIDVCAIEALGHLDNRAESVIIIPSAVTLDN